MKIVLCAAALATLAACSETPEIDRPGTWQPIGANDYNLRAMIADPQDLRYGSAAYTERGSGASRAVTRLLTDKRRTLLDVSLSKVAPGGSGGADPGLSDAPGGIGGPAAATAAAAANMSAPTVAP